MHSKKSVLKILKKKFFYKNYFFFATGGISLQGNPWLCTCENTWLGTWLRRWMRETLQLHASIIERNHHIQTMVRTITCQADYQQMSVLDTNNGGSATANNRMRIAASSGNGGLLPTEESESRISLIERPLVDLSESWTCSSALKTSSANTLNNTGSSLLYWILLVHIIWVFQRVATAHV